MKTTSTQLHKTPRNTKSDKKSSENRFNKAWQNVLNQQKKNQDLQQEIHVFTDSTMKQLEVSETQYASMLYDVCWQFLGFYQRKSLSMWQRDVLMAWFLEYLQTIVASPFSHHLDIDGLKQECQMTMKKIHPEMVEELSKIEDAHEFSNVENHDECNEPGEEEPLMEDMFEDLFADFINQNNTGSLDQENNFFDDLFKQHQEEQAKAEKQRTEEKELDKLMKAKTSNTLFRKLLRQLHPDLEQDEDRKKIKNQLVSQLTDARDNGDISTIFSMYAEHIGESPLLALGDINLDSATKILQRQFEQLRDEQHSIIAQAGPISANIYLRFHRKTKKLSQQAIDDHIDELKHDTQLLKEFSEYTTSLVKLKPYLEERYEATYF